MIKFKIHYHNIDIISAQKNINIDIKKINNDLINLRTFNISKEKKYIDTIKEIGNELIQNNKTFVIFGTGGSSLGAKALKNILQEKLQNQLIFIDNIDPIEFYNIIDNLDLKSTFFIIISKSGSTPETITQFLSIIEFYKSKNILEELSNKCLVITEKKDNPITAIAKNFSCNILEHDSEIGGRYSVFSNVGLLPAYLAGLNIEKICEGMQSILSELDKNLFNEHLISASVYKYLHFSNSINLNVLMTYSSKLFYFGKWFLQLWAESIGKNNKGMTPIHSVGTTDQHSQLQLYLDGPRDKFFTLITTDFRNQGLIMNDEMLNNKTINYLSNKTMGDLMFAEQKATLNTLMNKKLPLREIICNEINEYLIGQLMAFFIMETIVTCYLFDVDPFNQPAVEEGKKLAKSYLSN